ncbi:hypothetical protein NM688_g6095 [Phlebia brevispora]|uniref:Uncharacterized protein n=1 Tax=Phlebia brevispora TaxID=194682 RepID=A0ACC1SK26_9APHY|nr:hypothetical protein NM688_g6095 [Phlebia brevispora]
MATLCKLVSLLRAKKNTEYVKQVYQHVQTSLTNHTPTITSKLGRTPAGYVLVEDLHVSPGDPRPHFSVDAYKGPDLNSLTEPMGCIHVYEDGTCESFSCPRANAMEAYKKAASKFSG